MVIRHILLAGLAASASLAQAGVVNPVAAAGPTAAWSSVSAAGAQAAPANPLQVMMAGPGKWTGHTRMGDRSATSTMLFTQKTYGSPVQAAAVAAPVEVAPAAAAAPAPAAAPAAVELAAASPSQSVPMPAAMPPAVLDAPQANAGAGMVSPVDTAGLINAGGNVNAGVGAAIDAVEPAAVPEPATGMLMLAGLLGAGALVRRRK